MSDIPAEIVAVLLAGALGLVGWFWRRVHALELDVRELKRWQLEQNGSLKRIELALRDLGGKLDRALETRREK